MLITRRLFLKTWEPEDWLALRPIATDPEVMRYITGGMPWSDDQIRGFTERQLRLYKERGYCRWKLIERASGEMIGFCGIGHWRDNPQPEIGWWLARRWWGRGFATEAALTSLRDGFERLRLHRVMSVAEEANAASIRVMTKIGLRFQEAFEEQGVKLVRYGLDQESYTCGPPTGIAMAPD